MKIQFLKIENNIGNVIIINGLPEVGKRYFLEDLGSGTSGQNRILHLLIDELFTTGLFSFNAETKEELKDYIKKELGEGFEKIIYVDDFGKIKQVDISELKNIPEHIRKDKSRCLGRLKSWSDYTKNQRIKCINNLIEYMILHGVNTKRFNEILTDFNN